MTIESYSKRLCSPFQGVLLVVATDTTRALSFTCKRLEYMATAYAMEVVEYVQLYPQIIDNEKITALRVEASLRRAAQ